MASYIQNQTITNTTYTFDLPTTPLVENIVVTKKVNTVYPPDGSAPVVTTRFQINNNNPWFLSVDCDVSQLQKIIDTVQYVINHPV